MKSFQNSKHLPRIPTGYVPASRRHEIARVSWHSQRKTHFRNISHLTENDHKADFFFDIFVPNIKYVSRTPTGFAPASRRHEFARVSPHCNQSCQHSLHNSPLVTAPHSGTPIPATRRGIPLQHNTYIYVNIYVYVNTRAYCILALLCSTDAPLLRDTNSGHSSGYPPAIHIHTYFIYVHIVYWHNSAPRTTPRCGTPIPTTRRGIHLQ